MIVVTPGYTDEITYAAGGNPYGTSVSVDMEGEMKEKSGSNKKSRFLPGEKDNFHR